MAKKTKRQVKTKPKKASSKKQKPLNGMEKEFQVPRPLQRLADKYNASMLEKSRVTKEHKSNELGLIDAMKHHGYERCRVLKEGGGTRILRLANTDKVVIETPTVDKPEKKSKTAAKK